MKNQVWRGRWRRLSRMSHASVLAGGCRASAGSPIFCDGTRHDLEDFLDLAGRTTRGNMRCAHRATLLRARRPKTSDSRNGGGRPTDLGQRGHLWQRNLTMPRSLNHRTRAESQMPLYRRGSETKTPGDWAPGGRSCVAGPTDCSASYRALSPLSRGAEPLTCANTWWAILVSNQWPLPCQGSALPLS